MGIDWEYLLDADGADLADAYEERVQEAIEWEKRELRSNAARNEESPQLHYLNCPYAEKDEAKRLGAKWDKQKKKWFYISTSRDPRFSKWEDEAV